MAGDGREQPDGEDGEGEPWAQVGPEAADATVLGEVEHHRVGEPDQADGCLSNHDSEATVAGLLGPAEVTQAAVHSGEEDPHVCPRVASCHALAVATIGGRGALAYARKG